MKLRVFHDVDIPGDGWQSFPVPYATLRRVEIAFRDAMTTMLEAKWEVVDLPEGVKFSAGEGRNAWAISLPEMVHQAYTVRVPVQRGDGSSRAEVAAAIDTERARAVVEVTFDGQTTSVYLAPREAARFIRGVMKMAPALKTLDDMALRDLRKRTGDTQR